MTEKHTTYLHKVLGRIKSGRDSYIAAWSRFVPQQISVILLSVVIGIGAGALAELLKLMMRWIWEAVVVRFRPAGSINWLLLALPLLGIILAMAYQRYVLHRNLSCGTAQIIRLLRKRDGNYRIPFWTSLNSLIGCTLTVGFGSSAGSEGPTALSGAALGSSMGRLFGMERHWEKALVAIGAGASIAAIFKAPFGGMLYVLEVLELPMSTVAMLSLVLACAMASATAYLISGTPFDMALHAGMDIDGMLGWVMLLGVALGIYSLWYVWTKNLCGRFFNRLRNPWAKAVIAGVGMSVFVFMIPALYGEGFSVMAALSSGEYPEVFRRGILAVAESDRGMLYLLFVAILLVKGILVAAANNGGGVAGEMVPALFIGGIGGYLFGFGFNDLFGLQLPVWFMALTGMGAMLGNSSHAPLMSVFILSEMTNTLNFMPAYMICALISYVVMKLFMARSTWMNTGHDDLASLWHHFLGSGNQKAR